MHTAEAAFKQQQPQPQLQEQPQQLQGHFGNFFQNVQTHLAQTHLAFSKRYVRSVAELDVHWCCSLAVRSGIRAVLDKRLRVKHIPVFAKKMAKITIKSNEKPK